jgi:hypothetical protein
VNPQNPPVEVDPITPALPRSTAIVRQSVAVRFLIRGTFGLGGGNGCPRMDAPPVAIQTSYPTDLDPLDEAPRYLFQNLLDPNAKDPSAWCLRCLVGCNVRAICGYRLFGSLQRPIMLEVREA